MIKITREGKDYNLVSLKHIIHHVNLENVFKHGLLSHNLAHERGLLNRDISLDDVQDRRASKKVKINRVTYDLHEFVPFYFNPRNPMLFKRRNIQNELIIICVKTDLIDKTHTIFTDGNAASRVTKFYSGREKLGNVPIEILIQSSWNSEYEDIKKENKRIMCAEVLVHNLVEVSSFINIQCPNAEMKTYVDNVTQKVGNAALKIPTILDTKYFFI